ncbi:MAG: PhzF family phenazine biosynthesis protein [Legionella sp.]
MYSIEIYQIDAFTDKLFHGNPAAICLLNEWLNSELLQAIAVENNLSETAFVIENDQGFHIRWFTPKGEVELCGHSTLAAGFLLFELGKNLGNQICFSSLSGLLSVQKNSDKLTMDFPRLDYKELSSGVLLSGLIDKSPVAMFESKFDYLILLDSEQDVLSAQVNAAFLSKLSKRGLILTAECGDADFYSRCFYPKHNIVEDPVSGSAHCVLAPFWSARLNKNKLHAVQGSFRKGHVFCEVFPERVFLSGNCKWYLKGHLVL